MIKIFGYYVIIKEHDVIDRRAHNAQIDAQNHKMDDLRQDNISLRRWCSNVTIERDNIQRKYESCARESAELLKKYVKANKLISHLEHEIDRLKNGKL